MIKTIDKDKPIAMYYQLKQLLIEKIENRDFKENEKIPTEKELCEQYDISRATVRQALNELENEEYIYKIQGKGTFVSPKKFQQDLLQFYSFTEEMKKIGKKPTSQVLDFKISKVNNEKVKNILEIDFEEKIYIFTRLRLADEEPMMIETTYIPHKLFEGITRKELETRPLYDILVEDFNTSFSKAEEKFRPILIREDEAEQLNFIEGGPAILLERITYNEDERVIEYTKSVARGDKFEYRVELRK